MRLVVLAPYSKQIIMALNSCSKVCELDICLVGEEKRIKDLCLDSEFDYKLYSVSKEEEIIEIVRKLENSVLLIGDMQEFNQRKILKLKEDETGVINVFNVQGFENYFFTSSFSKKKNLYFEDHKKSINNARIFMESLDIKRINVGLISSNVTKSDILESNIVKMIGNNSHNMRILNPMTIKAALECKDKNINLMVFKNYEAAKIFKETISYFSYSTVASISYIDSTLHSSFYPFFIEYKENLNNEDLIFSLLMLEKAYKNSEKKVKNIA